jgi:aminoglycoside/choline kinase family phosphotransferase
MILKGGFEPHSRAVGMDQMFKREVRAYRDVFPAMPLPHPECYFTDYDGDRKQGLVLMEDLQARGVEFCSVLRPQTYEQISRRLRVLAKFHAQSWDSPDLAPGGKWGDLFEFFETMQSFYEHYMEPENWDRFVKAPRGAASSVRFHDAEWVKASWKTMTAFSRSLPQCVLHGDIHLGNLYIYPDGTPGFFDSLASTGPGMLEVAYHISGSLDVADRKRWEGSLIEIYLDELAANGVTVPSFDEALHWYTVLLLYGHFIFMTTEAERQSEPLNCAVVSRVSTAMLDLDFAGVIAAL